jgi:hypothetical protein
MTFMQFCILKKHKLHFFVIKKKFSFISINRMSIKYPSVYITKRISDLCVISLGKNKESFVIEKSFSRLMNIFFVHAYDK